MGRHHNSHNIISVTGHDSFSWRPAAIYVATVIAFVLLMMGNREAKAQSLAPGGTVGYWKFESISNGEFTPDSSGNGNDLNIAPIMGLNISPTLVVKPTDNPVPQFEVTDPSLSQNIFAADLPGNAHLGQRGNPNSTFTFSNDGFTLEGWVQLNDNSGTGPRQVLFQQKPFADTDATANYIFYPKIGALSTSVENKQQGVERFGKPGSLSGHEMALRLNTASGQVNVVSHLDFPTDGQSHFVSVAYDAKDGYVRFWLDGPEIFDPDSTGLQGHTELPIPVPTGALFDPGPTQLIVGAHTNASGVAKQLLNGQIDELRISSGYRRRVDMLDSQPILPQNIVRAFTLKNAAVVGNVIKNQNEANEAVIFFEGTTQVTQNDAPVSLGHKVGGHGPTQTIQSFADLTSGTIGTGHYDSYFVHIDPQKPNPNIASFNLGVEATYRFANDIVGLSAGGTLSDTAVFQSGEVTYGAGGGLEIGNGAFNPDYFSISPDRRTLTVDLRVGDPGADQFRVITLENIAPTAMIGGGLVFDANNLVLAVSGTGSQDPENEALTYAWNRGGNRNNALNSISLANAGITTTVGQSILSLTVTDIGQKSGSAAVPILYANAAPLAINPAGPMVVGGNFFSSGIFDDDLNVNSIIPSFEQVQLEFALLPIASQSEFGLGTTAGFHASDFLANLYGRTGTFIIYANVLDKAGDIDSVPFEITLIPEPTSFALGCCGLIALFGFAVLRKKRP